MASYSNVFGIANSVLIRSVNVINHIYLGSFCYSIYLIGDFCIIPEKVKEIKIFKNNCPILFC
jgi:hypothetical protein